MDLRKASRLALTALSGQIAVHAIGFLAGLVVVRMLSVDEYAVYTILYTCLGMLNVLTDAGVTNSTLAQCGKVWGDRDAVNRVLASAFKFRFIMACVVLLAALPFCCFLLLQANVAWPNIVVLLVVLGLLFFSGLMCQITELPLRLMQQIRAIQLLQCEAVATRLAFSYLLLVIYPAAGMALIAATISQGWLQRRLTKRTGEYGIAPTEVSPESVSEFKEAIWRALPLAAYFAVSSQISQVLLSIFGKVSEIAGLGAISRFAMIYSIAGVVFTQIGTPWFSKLKQDGRPLLYRYMFLMALYLTATVVTTMGVLLLSPVLLWLLGPNYQGLAYELSLLMFTSGVAAVAGASYQLSAARGVIITPSGAIAGSLLVQIAGIALLDVSSIQGVLLLGLAVSVFSLLANSGYFAWRTLSTHR